MLHAEGLYLLSACVRMLLALKMEICLSEAHSLLRRTRPQAPVMRSNRPGCAEQVGGISMHLHA
jgi:hypothetical protein